VSPDGLDIYFASNLSFPPGQQISRYLGATRANRGERFGTPVRLEDEGINTDMPEGQPDLSAGGLMLCFMRASLDPVWFSRMPTSTWRPGPP